LLIDDSREGLFLFICRRTNQREALNVEPKTGMLGFQTTTDAVFANN